MVVDRLFKGVLILIAKALGVGSNKAEIDTIWSVMLKPILIDISLVITMPVIAIIAIYQLYPDFYLEKNTLFWIYSTMAQSTGILLGFFVVFFIYVLQRVDSMELTYLSLDPARLAEYAKTKDTIRRISNLLFLVPFTEFAVMLITSVLALPVVQFIDQNPQNPFTVITVFVVALLFALLIVGMFRMIASIVTLIHSP
jgi:hypothetical protein